MNRLRTGSLSFVEVLATSVGLIGLSMTPVLVAPYMYASAGNGSWLAYLFGGIMLFFVALSLNQFTKRSSSVGSMFGYAAANLGPAGGAVAGWCLIWAYIFVGAAVFGALALFVQQIAARFGGTVPAPVTMVVIALLCFYFSYSGVQLSTIVMLSLEVLSVSIICVIVAVVFFKHGLTPDAAQVHLHGVHFGNIGLGIATAIFSLVGFESASAFGEEAKNPLVTIPRAVLASVVIASVFFIVVIYAEIVGLTGTGTTLDKLAAPLGTLADQLHIGFLRLPILIGACFSAFSVALGCVSTGARIIVAMSRSHIFAAQAAAIDPKHETPHVALGITVLAMLAIGLFMIFVHVAPIDVFNFCGTLSSCAFVVVYAMIVVAATLYLKRIGERKTGDVLVAAAGFAFLFVPAVTLFYPAPAPPVNFFPYLFALYALAGIVWFTLVRRPEKLEV